MSRRRIKTITSNGPDVKLRGTVKQIVQKYEVLADEARGNKDVVLAEHYEQHAEHYRKEI